MLWGPVTELQDQHPGLEVVMAEVSAAGSAVSVSTAEAKSEKIKNALNKIKKKKKGNNRTSLFPFQLGKKSSGKQYHLTYSY